MIKAILNSAIGLFFFAIYMVLGLAVMVLPVLHKVL
jgi:hypothetical protein